MLTWTVFPALIDSLHDQFPCADVCRLILWLQCEHQAVSTCWSSTASALPRAQLFTTASDLNILCVLRLDYLSQFTLLSSCRPHHHTSLSLHLFLVQYYWVEPPPANQQAASHLCHQPVLEEGIGLCDLSLEGRWNARSAQPLGTTRLPHNGNHRSLGSRAITSNSAPGKHRAPPFFLLSAALVALWSTFMCRNAGGLRHSPLLITHPLWNRLLLCCFCLFCAEELIFGISLLHVR